MNKQYEFESDRRYSINTSGENLSFADDLLSIINKFVKVK